MEDQTLKDEKLHPTPQTDHLKQMLDHDRQVTATASDAFYHHHSGFPGFPGFPAYQHHVHQCHHDPLIGLTGLAVAAAVDHHFQQQQQFDNAASMLIPLPNIETHEIQQRKRSCDESFAAAAPAASTYHESEVEEGDEYEQESQLAVRESKRSKKDKHSSFSGGSSSPNRQWNIMFERLKAYKEKHGNCLVPKRYPEDPKLGTWVETQRVQYKRLHREYDASSGAEAVLPNKRLDQERLNKLEDIGFAWSAKHVRKTSAIPETAAAPPSPSPVSKPNVANPTPPSSAYRKQPSSASAVAAAPLPQVSTCAPPSASRTSSASWNDHQWEDMYRRLVLYKETHGDCLVPRKYEADPKLGSWVESQRILFNRENRFVEAAGPVVAAAAGNAPLLNEWPLQPKPYHRQDAWPPGVSGGEHDDGVEAVDSDLVGSGSVRASTKKLTKDQKERLDALGFVWSLRSKRTDDHWDEMFRQLVEYKNIHGDTLVPSRYEQNMKLGKWVETQRYEYTKLQRVATPSLDPAADDGKPRATNPRLTEERLRRLESIGFEWKVRNKMKRYYDKQWQEMFERLLKYKQATGHCVVPKRYPPDMKLGTWVHTQRIQYRKLINGSKKDAGSEGNDSDDNANKSEEDMSFRLTDERRKRLEEIGFVWSARESDVKTEQQPRVTRNSYDDLWDTMYERLVAFKGKNGHCLVPKRYREDQKLGTWVDTQRVQYKKKMNKKMPGDQDESDFSSCKAEGLDVSTETSLPPGFAGPTKPPTGRLTDERIQRLEALGFVWSLRDDWMKHYEELKAYHLENGNCNVPARYAKNRKLGIWVSAQRQQYKIIKSAETWSPSDSKKQRPASLTPERIALLDQLGFTWTIRSRDSLGESWNQRLADLKAYKKRHGNCLVPSRYPPNPELGIWVGTQRTQYRLYQKAKESGQADNGASAMNEERIRQLEELGFIWALRGTEGINRRDATMSSPSSEVDNDNGLSGQDQDGPAPLLVAGHNIVWNVSAGWHLEQPPSGAARHDQAEF